jgi:hypothetical protein
MKITQLTVEQKRLSTAEAELWVFVHVERSDDATEIRGCLVGPKCVSAETVQINYPLKRIRSDDHATNVLLGRILIPEPNLWTPETPFVYEGNVELWHEGKVADLKPIRAAFRMNKPD